MEDVQSHAPQVALNIDRVGVRELKLPLAGARPLPGDATDRGYRRPWGGLAFILQRYPHEPLC